MSIDDKRAAVLRWIEEQEALCEAATPGPWYLSDGSQHLSAPGRDVYATIDPRIQPWTKHNPEWQLEVLRAAASHWSGDLAATSRHEDVAKANAALAVASRSVLPLALAALRATVEGIRHEEVEDCWYTCPLALDNAGESLCCHERDVAAGRCTCGADTRLDAIFCSLGLQEDKL